MDVQLQSLLRQTQNNMYLSLEITCTQNTEHTNEGLPFRQQIFFIKLLNVDSLFYKNREYEQREKIIRDVLYLEVGAGLWRHQDPQQQHEGWRPANKWSDGNENSLYRNTVCMRATTIFNVSTGDIYY